MLASVIGLKRHHMKRPRPVHEAGVTRDLRPLVAFFFKDQVMHRSKSIGINFGTWASTIGA